MQAAPTTSVDITIIGAGAAGLAAAIFAARRLPDCSIVALDGAKKLGAKILVAGGGRCNVTNREVTPEGFWGGSRNTVRRILAAFPEQRTVAFFREIGVDLHEEEHGKLFPDSNSAKTVLAALLREAQRRGIQVLSDHRVVRVSRRESEFLIETIREALKARAVVLATGGLSLPKTGSDGHGYSLARALGHTVTPTTPGLAPLILEGDFHAPLSGVSHDVELTIRARDAKPLSLRGAMLWTHFGVSGPVVLDASRHWHRSKLEGRPVEISASFFPALDLQSVEKQFLDLAVEQPRLFLHNALARWLPARVASAVLDRLRIDGQTALAHLNKETRRDLCRALLAWPLPVRDSRGYGFAEVTAGGVPLDEIDSATMTSRKCPGLFLVGEILDVDGRIGGFNFQWAWSTGFVAAMGLARMFAPK